MEADAEKVAAAEADGDSALVPAAGSPSVRKEAEEAGEEEATSQPTASTQGLIASRSSLRASPLVVQAVKGKDGAAGEAVGKAVDAVAGVVGAQVADKAHPAAAARATNVDKENCPPVASSPSQSSPSPSPLRARASSTPLLSSFSPTLNNPGGGQRHPRAPEPSLVRRLFAAGRRQRGVVCDQPTKATEAISSEAPQADLCDSGACGGAPAAVAQAEAVAVAVAVVEAAFAMALEATSPPAASVSAPALVQQVSTAKTAIAEATKEQLVTLSERPGALETEDMRSSVDSSQVDSTPAVDALSGVDPTAVDAHAAGRRASAVKLTPWQVALSGWLRRISHAASIFFTLLQMEATKNRRLTLNS